MKILVTGGTGSFGQAFAWQVLAGHVPICEFNPAEAVKTNIQGSQNVIDAAIDAGVHRTVVLSTDKAVNPVNLYGATKLCAEELFVHGNAYAGPRDIRFSCIRYGNIMGSRGSVIPLFRRQAESGVLTITDRAMTRFWLSLRQAVELVLEAVGLMKGGEIFVPKIPSMRIMDLARAIAPAVRIDEVGRRPGQKLHEILLTAEESSNGNTDWMSVEALRSRLASCAEWVGQNSSGASSSPGNSGSVGSMLSGTP